MIIIKPAFLLAMTDFTLMMLPENACLVLTLALLAMEMELINAYLVKEKKF